MAFDAYKLGKFQNGMRRRLAELRVKTEDSLDFAMETMMQDRVDSYFRVEEGLGEIDHSLGLIEGELKEIHDLTGAQRLEARLEFIEDRWEEFDSEIRQRPRRRRRRISMADFFKAAGGGGGATSPGGDIQSPTDAYRILGLDYGSSLSDVTAAFRRQAKKLHPDANEGDRSEEAQLRRIIEAYQFLKEHLSLSNTEPPRPFA